MKDNKKMIYTIIRMGLAICGMACIIAEMIIEPEGHYLLAVGMCFVAVANIFSNKGYCLIGKRRCER